MLGPSNLLNKRLARSLWGTKLRLSAVIGMIFVGVFAGKNPKTAGRTCNPKRTTIRDIIVITVEVEIVSQGQLSLAFIVDQTESYTTSTVKKCFFVESSMTRVESHRCKHS